jgi:hypothetical protein
MRNQTHVYIHYGKNCSKLVGFKEQMKFYPPPLRANFPLVSIVMQGLADEHQLSKDVACDLLIHSCGV